MLLYLPKKFDENEWFISISIGLAIVLITFLPKRFPRIISILLYLFVVASAKIVDHILSGSFKFDLYDYNDGSKYGLFDSLLQLVLYPLAGYLLIYLYDYWRDRRGNRIIIILIGVILSGTFEKLSTHFNVFHYKKWELHFSYLFYFMAFPAYIYYLHLLKNWLKLVKK